ncbi:uncharacterized protein PAC_00149 [Phialocephala subalpina]|uniref:Uncharacterized protein n=1 Tax=Phialocephala subalpina TaxID=576137 RepID=A0A1L7WBW1_9HELO|nr:uncharacterized protein PAC_00149 [Phialocephala subalpina]
MSQEQKEEDTNTDLSTCFGHQNKLKNWQQLCRDLGVKNAEEFSSITQCKTALKSKHVNIYGRRTTEVQKEGEGDVLKGAGEERGSCQGVIEDHLLMGDGGWLGDGNSRKMDAALVYGTKLV